MPVSIREPVQGASPSMPLHLFSSKQSHDSAPQQIQNERRFHWRWQDHPGHAVGIFGRARGRRYEWSALCFNPDIGGTRPGRGDRLVRQGSQCLMARTSLAQLAGNRASACVACLRRTRRRERNNASDAARRHPACQSLCRRRACVNSMSVSGLCLRIQPIRTIQSQLNLRHHQTRTCR